MSPNVDVFTARQLADEAARDFATRARQSDFELGRLLCYCQDVEVEKSFGFTFDDWARRRLDLGRRAVQDRLRVARCLETLPVLSEHAERGEIAYSVLRELVRVATPDTEAEWLAESEGKTGPEVQRMVNGRARGDLPADHKRPEAEQHRVSLTLGPQAMAMWKEARRVKTEQLGRRVEDDELLMDALAALLDPGSSRDAGRSAFQIHLTKCDDCATTELPGGLVATETEAAMANCDAQVVPPIETGKPATQTIPPRVRRAVLARQKHACAVPGCENRAFLHLHHTKPRAEGGGHHPDELVGICPSHHRRAHDGALVIRALGGGDFSFEHADGTAYGARQTSGARSQVLGAAFEVLHGMGFRETEARQLLDAVRTTVRESDEVPDVVRYALRAVSHPGGLRERVVLYRAA